MKVLRVSVGSIFVVGALVGACTGGASQGEANGANDSDAGSVSSGGSAKATPQAIFEGRLELGDGNDCPDVGPLFAVGELGDVAASRPSQAVKDGDAVGEGTVSVSCTVSQAAAGAFAVNGTVALSGPNGGLFRIDGTFKTSGEQTDVHAVFSRRTNGSVYESSTCVVRYATSFQGVATGRVWGEITCAKAASSSAGKSCDATAQFRLENCAQ